ncbi:uncharacterized protein VTP21DRAFT_9703 [Calcarisporiella thermophila]|uniref:uncharacterized protein n=1 Tax=Calcarisporiella thermophila TaxID=911321 RepID=UPI003742ACE3
MRGSLVYRSILIIMIIITCMISLKMIDYYYQPKYISPLIDPNYACHDAYSCFKHDNITVNNMDLSLPAGRKYAFFSAMYTTDYLSGVLVLAFSIRKFHPDIPMHLIYKKDKPFSADVVCRLTSVGWQLYPVNEIDIPTGGVKEQFRDNYLKLHLWNSTEFDALVYLDADTIVRDNIQELFRLVDKDTYLNKEGFEFASALDNYGSISQDFNAGVLVVRPNRRVFQELMRLYKLTDDYDAYWAEQGFLNEYFRFRYIHLPEQYNFNVAFWERQKLAWRRFESEMKVIHYTGVIKPFKITDKSIEQKYKEVFKPWDEMKRDLDTNISFNKCIS